MKNQRMRKLSLSIAVATTLLAAALTSSGCKGKDEVKAAAPPPPVVIVADVEQKTVPIYSEYIGQTKAHETVELRARVEGVLEKVYFREGQPVKKGALLFTIDKRPYQAALQSAKAILTKAESDLAQARQRTDVIKAQAELADAQAVQSKAESDLHRIAPLAKEKAVTELELDAAVAAAKSAKAQVDAKQANLTNLEASVKYTIERAAAEVSAAKARVTQAELDLSYCDVYSPMSGIIGFKNVDTGNLVGHGEATLLATVSSSEPILVDFSLSEAEFMNLTSPEALGSKRINRQIELILADDTTHPYAGALQVVDRTVDPQTGTMKVEAAFPNPKSYLRPGQFARIRAIASQRENAILIPQKAIQEIQGAKTVMVVDNQNKVSVRTVTVGDKSGNDVIVLQGVNPGEHVIVEGMQKVRPGSEVKPTSAPAGETAKNTEGS
ncbi:MAG TPA: efflux RND transporter periplasmic adaptor subunit [Pyrinomonadaceae bacterium]|nr:efflux RND transporter periplasmic adaptor subunit [Pyrinomonadaceae bacterium]